MIFPAEIQTQRGFLAAKVRHLRPRTVEAQIRRHSEHSAARRDHRVSKRWTRLVETRRRNFVEFVPLRLCGRNLFEGCVLGFVFRNCLNGDFEDVWIRDRLKNLKKKLFISNQNKYYYRKMKR